MEAVGGSMQISSLSPSLDFDYGKHSCGMKQKVSGLLRPSLVIMRTSGIMFFLFVTRDKEQNENKKKTEQD